MFDTCSLVVRWMSSRVKPGNKIISAFESYNSFPKACPGYKGMLAINGADLMVVRNTFFHF